MNETLDNLPVETLPVYTNSQALDQPQLPNGIMYPQLNGNMDIRDNTIFAAQLVIGQKTWTHNIVFTPTDYQTMSWGTGIITFADGTTKSIIAGNTGGISATTYVYFNNTTALQITTTYSVATGDNNVLLAIVTPSGSIAGKCVITALGSTGTTIDGSKIVTGKVQSADGRTYFDLDNSQLVTSDGTNPRVVIGTV